MGSMNGKRQSFPGECCRKFQARRKGGRTLGQEEMERVALADYRAEAVKLGLGRLVALHHRSSTSYQIHKAIRCLYF